MTETDAFNRGTQQAVRDLVRAEIDQVDHHLYAPNNEDTEPWCHFGKGTVCLNGDRCQNPNHRGEGATP